MTILSFQDTLPVQRYALATCSRMCRQRFRSDRPNRAARPQRQSQSIWPAYAVHISTCRRIIKHRQKFYNPPYHAHEYEQTGICHPFTALHYLSALVEADIARIDVPVYRVPLLVQIVETAENLPRDVRERGLGEWAC